MPNPFFISCHVWTYPFYWFFIRTSLFEQKSSQVKKFYFKVRCFNMIWLGSFSSEISISMSVGIVNEDVVFWAEYFWMVLNVLELFRISRIFRVEKHILLIRCKLYNIILIIFLNVLNAELGRVIQKSWFFMHEQDNLKMRMRF